jgi:hypothetical protein
MERIIFMLSWIRNHKNMVIASAAIVVFAAIMILVFIQIERLNSDVENYKTQVFALEEKTKEYEATIEENKELTVQMEQSEKRASALREMNKELRGLHSDIAVKNDELERQNGELSKKFDGLSKP